MIFNMEKKFNESGIYWDHSNGGWIKSILGLNKSHKNGYSLIGDFISSGMNRNDYEPGLYLNCNKFDGHIVYQLVKLLDNETLELVQELVDPSRGWAVEFWESIEANLDETPLTPSYPDHFLNMFHLKGYLQYVNIHEFPEHTLEEVCSEVNTDIDFDLPTELCSHQDIIGLIFNVMYKQYDFGTCAEITQVDNLLNLTYLKNFKGDANGMFVNFEGNLIAIFYIQDKKMNIRWFRHHLE